MYTLMHGFSPFYSPFDPALMLPFLILTAVWTLAIKGYALWHAARNGQRAWFVAILIINTLGILELIYLVWFRSDKKTTSNHVHAAHTPAHDSSVQA